MELNDIQRYLEGQADYAEVRYPGDVDKQYALLKAAVRQVIEQPEVIPSELMNVGNIAEDVDTEPTAEDILRQMGYYREDTLFMSLNLTGRQFSIIQEACSAYGSGDSPEHAICDCIDCWLRNA